MDTPDSAAGLEARADALLAAAASGGVETVNGLAIGNDYRSAYATHWSDVDGERLGTLVEYSSADGYRAPRFVFSEDAFHDYQPTLSPDERQIFFTSTRPVDESGAAARQNCWFAERLPDGVWAAPEPVQGLVSPYWDGHALLTRGGWLYFASERPGGLGMVDIYRARWRDGTATGIENVTALNSEHSDQDLFIDADEQFIVFARYAAATQDLDLYYATRAREAWNTPEPLAAANTEAWELAPYIDRLSGALLFKRGDLPGFQVIELQALPKKLRAAIRQSRRLAAAAASP